MPTRNLSAIERNLSTIKRSLSTIKRNLSTIKRNLSTIKRNLSTIKRHLSTIKRHLSAIRPDEAGASPGLAPQPPVVKVRSWVRTLTVAAGASPGLAPQPPQGHQGTAATARRAGVITRVPLRASPPSHLLRADGRLVRSQGMGAAAHCAAVSADTRTCRRPLKHHPRPG